MDLLEKRYKRYYEKVDYGWFWNAVFDIITMVNGFSPSYLVARNIKLHNFLNNGEKCQNKK